MKNTLILTLDLLASNKSTLIKIFEFPTFWSTPWPACLLWLPISKMVWQDPNAPKPWEEIELAEKALLGVWAWPQGPNHLPQNYL